MSEIFDVLLVLGLLIFVVGMCGVVLWLIDYLVDD